MTTPRRSKWGRRARRRARSRCGVTHRVTMSSSDLKDDVDRLFACFKCGLSTPESALQEKKLSGEARRRRSSVRADRSGPCDSGTSGSSKETPQKLDSSKSMAVKFNVMKHISPVVFYGSPDGAPVKKPESLLRLLREIHVDLKEQNNLSPREEVWATFPRQEEAVRFAKMHAQVHLFSYQDHLNGQRRFLVCTYEEFWRRYEKMDSKVRHHYEVIVEGLPCHLYFDLEFNKRDNPDRNADEMVDILISVTFRVLFDKYSIQGNHEWIVELDSSTEEKFSRHLIIRIPQTAFKDNTHVGAFVSESDKEIFMESLICRMDVDCKKQLVCKLDLDFKKRLLFDFEVNRDHGQTPEIPGRTAGLHSSTNITGVYLTGRSPFPTMDSFIEAIASVGNILGKIRSWYWFSPFGLMVYNMSRSRYCERIGREHKSNHVMYVVDFRSAIYYQKCYDPDCKGYRSPFRPLPYNVMPDGMPFPNLSQRENIGNALNIDFHFDNGTLKENSLDNSEWITDSCKKDTRWWQEAIEYADHIENMGEIHESFDQMSWEKIATGR